ncbi:D-alanyl-D-alanine carboxypeptidase [Nitratireductor mangrovi]|uniref:D-alanyl-D-alanine carboxypeptidase n=1 Tax=Nitratireductor mangrovi TaxID=2599600 RepID=A0A5B8L451_9HYPH|nr:D-alanyl-D-alanine carboxypeptidase family protein [Nitratireductor mangrovi]QDZ02450.1 D-alanyl-D-alanine carboxypeptidase [Nitratireductor mangrovi]
MIGTGLAAAARFFLCLFLAVAVTACSTSETLRSAAPTSKAAASSKYAAIVMDGYSGEVLFARNADSPRYPASLTKMMTLYLLFEALEDGRLSRSSQITFSPYAASRPPSKLGFKAGQSIDVDTAIRALAVKSANDVATAVAEHLGGSEAQFAQMMTAKARQLGMVSTVFRNASGLPDSSQRTTARDMARLSMALRSRFPGYYPYFSQTKFTFRGRTINGHNKVLETVRGADGIKTGYTRASGFNLATSVSRDGRRLIAVVMGESSATQRNAHMADLVATYMPKTSSRNGGSRALAIRRP